MLRVSRVFWSDDDCLLLLNIIEEKHILKLIDGRKYRKTEIYKIVEDEFSNRGVTDKTAFQIENKWKNLKKMYIITKKSNSVSGASTNTCDYYEILDRLLGTRPSISNVSQGIDAAELQSLERSDLGMSVDDCLQTIVESPPSNQKKKGAVKPRQSEVEDSDLFLTNFLEKSKELVDYEIKCFEEIEKKQSREFVAAMKDVFVETNQIFLTELRNVFKENSDPQSSASNRINPQTNSPKPGCNGTNLEEELTEFINFN